MDQNFPWFGFSPSHSLVLSFSSSPYDLSFSGFYSQKTIRFFQPLIEGVMAAMAAVGVHCRR
jgi:hypothetical protein